jgi:hypothetical protein
MLAERKLMEILREARLLWPDDFPTDTILDGREVQRLVAAAYLIGFWESMKERRTEWKE